MYIESYQGSYGESQAAQEPEEAQVIPVDFTDNAPEDSESLLIAQQAAYAEWYGTKNDVRPQQPFDARLMNLTWALTHLSMGGTITRQSSGHTEQINGAEVFPKGCTVDDLLLMAADMLAEQSETQYPLQKAS